MATQLKFAPVKQRNHKYINKSIDQWLDIHFGDTSFNGRVVIGHRKPGNPGIYPMSARSLTELRPYVKMIHASSRLDYYITANTVSGTKRLKDELFGLQNIVIDVDLHDKNTMLHAIPGFVEAFIWYAKRDLFECGVIPTPNSIVRTGRGVQLWWALVPCYGGRNYEKSRYHHIKIKNTFMYYIDSILEQYADKLGGLALDDSASSNLVGFFRLPYTYNTVAKRYSSVEILHSERYDQRELTKIKNPAVGTRFGGSRKTTKYIPLKDSDRKILTHYQGAGARRVMQLIRLRNLRDNEIGEESRDKFNFSVYNALRMSLDHRQAMARLRAFNAGFKEPMTDHELEISLCAAVTRDGYKYSNVKLIKLLEITPEEQDAIGLFPYTQKHRSRPNAGRDQVRSALKEDRNQKILELINQGVSQAETARILGIGKNTVGRLLKRLRDTQNTEEVEAIVVPYEEQNDRHHFGSIFEDLLRNSATRNQRLFEQEGGLFVLPDADSS